MNLTELTEKDGTRCRKKVLFKKVSDYSYTEFQFFPINYKDKKRYANIFE